MVCEVLGTQLINFHSDECLESVLEELECCEEDGEYDHLPTKEEVTAKWAELKMDWVYGEFRKFVEKLEERFDVELCNDEIFAPTPFFVESLKALVIRDIEVLAEGALRGEMILTCRELCLVAREEEEKGEALIKQWAVEWMRENKPNIA